jgi:hypothetical protein
MSGGPGYGDPLERNLSSIIKDLDDEIYTSDIVKNVYGVIADYDESSKKWKINQHATDQKRKKIRSERREKSMTFEEFWRYERKKITEGRLREHVKRMYKESLELSDRWAKEFREFWEFDNDFKMEEI